MHVPRDKGSGPLMQDFWGDRYFSMPYREPAPVASPVMDADAWYDETLESSLSEHLSTHAYDAVILIRFFLSKALVLFPKETVKIIDTNDIFSNRHELFIKQGLAPKWFSTTPDQEAKALDRADALMAMHARDKEFFSGLFPEKPVFCVGHWTPIFQAQKRAKRNHLLFVGTLNHMNEHGLRFFIKEIFPLAKTLVPDLKLLVAGRVGEAVQGSPGVTCLGEVANLESVYAQADVAINPVLFGTGLSTKSIEAMGFGIPLISTRAGAEWLEERKEPAFKIADSPEEFSRAIADLLKNSKEYEYFSRKGLEFAQAYNQQSENAIRFLFNFSKVCQ